MRNVWRGLDPDIRGMVVYVVGLVILAGLLVWLLGPRVLILLRSGPDNL